MAQGAHYPVDELSLYSEPVSDTRKIFFKVVLIDCCSCFLKYIKNFACNVLLSICNFYFFQWNI